MKITWLTLITLCFTPALFAAQGEPQAQKRFGDSTCLPSYLALYDTDKDGVISESERQVMVRARDQIRDKLCADWDTDGNGTISDQEREQAQTKLCTMITQDRTARFTAADTDGDAVLSYAEFILLPGMANKLEKNPDDTTVLAIFNRMNTDGVEGISLAEFLAAVQQCDQLRTQARDGTGLGE